MQQPIKDKRCLVTGAAGGIGLGLVQALLEAGAAQVWMADAVSEKLSAAAAPLEEQYPGRVTAKVLDVTDETAFDALCAEMAAALGGIDLLVNNAGLGTAGFLVQMEEAAIRKLLEVNVLGVIHGCRAVLPYMVRQGEGRIVNIGSLASLVPLPWRTIYTASKYAVLGFTQTLRIELDWMGSGVRVHTVCPSAVATDIWQGTTPKTSISPNEAAGEILEGIAREDEIILVSDHAREVYGHLDSRDEAGMQADREGLLEAYKPLFYTPELVRGIVTRKCRD